MTEAPLYSIITVTKNNITGLKKTHLSVSQQSFNDYEWIVIDDASDDGTKEYLKEDTDAQWVCEPDDGIYHAMNKGIERAKGMFLLFLNAGDELAHSDVLQDLATYIAERDLIPDFIYGDSMEEMDGAVPNYKPARPYTKMDLGMFTHHQAMLYRREALKREGGDLRYNNNFIIAGDYDFTCRFLLSTNNVVYWPSPICLFESGGVSQRYARTGRREQFKIKRELNLCSPLKAQLIRIAQVSASIFKAMFPQMYWSMKGY